MLLWSWAVNGPGLFDEALEGHGNETEWMMRYRRTGGRIVYLPDAWILHRRTPDMLRLRSRLLKGFNTGAHDARSAAALGRPARGFRRLINSSRPLAHAVTRRCSEGLTQAAMSVGFGLEALSLSWSNRRASALATHMTESLTVSIVIPTWRRAPWLERCLEGLLSQSHTPNEIVVVGRPEDEDARSVVVGHGLRVRWVEVNRPGHVAPVLRGMNAATGEVVAFLDDDVVPEDGWVRPRSSNLSKIVRSPV